MTWGIEPATSGLQHSAWTNHGVVCLLFLKLLNNKMETTRRRRSTDVRCAEQKAKGRGEDGALRGQSPSGSSVYNGNCVIGITAAAAAGQ
jgi:hypothetical protein